ncbi:hypothetical protein Trisim1_006284 [Trichoderma cf. simile WF8]
MLGHKEVSMSIRVATSCQFNELRVTWSKSISRSLMKPDRAKVAAQCEPTPPQPTTMTKESCNLCKLSVQKKKKKKHTYNSRCSLMVTHSTTNLPLIGLTLGEQTGPRIFQWIWSLIYGGADGTPSSPLPMVKRTYNSRCSPVVTHLTTNLPVSGLTMGEQTGPRIFHYLWSYVLVLLSKCLITAFFASRGVVTIASFFGRTLTTAQARFITKFGWALVAFAAKAVSALLEIIIMADAALSQKRRLYCNF